MLRRFALLCALAAAACAPTPAPQSPTLARTPQDHSDSLKIAALAHSLVRAAATDSARAAHLYEWIARNVRYDLPGYFAGRLDDVSAENVYRTRTAVCGGFVKLFTRMAADVGLTATPILGYAKGFDYTRGHSSSKPNHSWAAIRISGQWRLVDPTWAAGVVDGGRFRPAFTWDYFLVNPDELILSHFPKQAAWQMVRQPMTRAEFERMPLVPRAVVDAGFSPAEIRAAAMHSDVRGFPLVGTAQASARVISAPVSGTLRRGSRVAIDVVWPGAGDVALVSGKIWTHLRRYGEHFRGEASASDTKFYVVGKAGNQRNFETLLQYAVQ